MLAARDNRVMARITSTAFLPVSASEAYAWHSRPGALARLIPPWERVRLVHASDGIYDGAKAEMSASIGPFRRRWTAEHHDCVPGVQFCDRQERGPFSSWDHTHRFLTDGDDCRIEDTVDFRMPLGPLGRALGEASVSRRLQRMFAWRKQRIIADLGRHRTFRALPRLRVALAGATGLVGSQLSAFMTSGGHTVMPMVRPGSRHAGIAWDPSAGSIDSETLGLCDAVVHLGGHSIAGRWTARRRREILDSRVRSTRLLAETLARSARKPAVMVVASAVGWYGDRGDEIVDEFSAGGDGFLAEVCRAWEDACEPARQAGIRTINLRIGMVISGRGGALPSLITPYELGLGGPIGSGAQWVSWIAIDDLIYALHHALMSPSVSGVVNAVAPEPVRQRDFARILATALHRPAAIRTPAWAVRLAFGQMGVDLMLGGCRVVSRRLDEEVFAFSCPDLQRAFAWELGLGLDPARKAEPETPSSSLPS